MQGLFARIYRAVKKVPKGKVVTYGQVAVMVGKPGAARTVGWALHAINDPHSGIPWHRVINAKGSISACTTHTEILQRKLLEAEGIRFDRNGRINLAKYLWKPTKASYHKVQPKP
jgi:methylated-DNA-protein-cysteine methyltransferase-like protein